MTDDLEQTTIRPHDAYEPAADAAPAASVQPPDAAPRGRRYRWVIALGLVAVVVAASLLALSLFAGRAANATVLSYVPEDSIMYGEVRMDLPGDQRANLGAFLSKFPGFADQSTIETKVDEVLDRLLGGATDGSQAFSTDIKPWFGGEVAFSLGALPDPDVVTTDPTVLGSTRFLVLLSVKDEAAARTWFDATVAETGVTTTTETYNGATLTLFGGDAEQLGAFAILAGKVAIAGDPTSVKAAVDTKGASAFAAQAGPKAGLDATTGDHVGFVYVAIRPLMDWSMRLSESQGGASAPSGALLGMVPDWAAFALRVEGDALRMETIAPTPASAPGPRDNRTSSLAEHVPSNAIVLGIAHDYGRSVLDALAAYRSDPTLKPFIESIDQAAGVLGGTDAALGWVGDTGLTITRADGSLEGGLVIVPTDRAAAERLFTSIRTFVTLGGATLGITVRDEAYAGTTITIVDLGELGDLAGLTGIPVDQLGSAALPAGRVELAYAITDQIVVLGSGPAFVKHVLDTTAATSIASTDRYKAVAARVGQGTSLAFADLVAIRELVESGMADADAASRAEYEENVKPFLTPFDALAAGTSIDGELSRSTVIITVK